MKRALIVLALLLSGGGAYWYFVMRSPAVEQVAGRRGRGGGDASLIPVLAVRSELRNVPVYLDGLGTVQAFNQVQIRPQVDGPLIEVRFREGQDVRAGDVLARIDPRPYQAALDQAEARKQQNQASLANAKLDAARYAKLAASAYSSAQQSDTARAQVAQLEAQVRGDQAGIDTARTQLGYTTITAPIDGRTGLRQVDAGNIARPGDTVPITVLTQLKPISVVFTLPQQALPAVVGSMQDGMPVVQALRQGGGGSLDVGQLAVLDNQVDPTTGTIKLKATFSNAELLLWPGGFVNVRMLARTERDVVTVPTAAVQRGPRGSFIFVVRDDKTAERRAVTVGHEDGQTSVLADGARSGELVVVDGAQRLTEGTKVALAGPDGNAPEAVPRERGAPGTAQRRGRSAS